MSPEIIHTQLTQLLPAQFAEVVNIYDIPKKYLPPSACISEKARDLIYFAKQRPDGLERLQKVIEDITSVGGVSHGYAIQPRDEDSFGDISYLKLKSLSLQKYKNIANANSLFLDNLNILIGPNGCGKSNLIAALQFLKNATNLSRTSVSPLDSALLAVGNDRILHLNLSPPAKVDMQFQFAVPGNESTGTVLELALLVQGGNNKVLVEKERLTTTQASAPDATPFVYYDFHSERSGEGRVSVNQADAQGKEHFETLRGLPANELGLTYIPRWLENSKLIPEQTPVYKIRRQLLEYLENWRFYNTNHMNLHDIRYNEPKIGGTDTLLSASGENLALVMFNLVNQSFVFEEQINAAMRLIFPDSRRIRALPSGRLSLTLEWYFDGLSQSKPLYLDELSDGSVRMLCWAVLLYAPVLPSLLVIDEPELGLHPAWLKILAQWIIQAAERTQIIVTTHSPDLLDYFTEHLEKVIAFKPVADGYQPEHLQREKLAAMLEEGWQLGDLYRVGDPSVGGWPW